MDTKLSILISTVFFIVVPISVASAQFSQEVTITSTPNPLGAGARALGMGSAFIAMADDATAASWNPGGLIQLERPEVSFVWYYTHRKEDYDFLFHQESNGSEYTDTSKLNYFSAAYPFTLFGKNMIVSLNYQRLYDLDKTLKFDVRSVEVSAPALDIIEKINYESEGGIKAFSPAYALQITENLSVGFTLNFWNDILGGRNGWKEEFRSSGQGLFAGTPIILSSTSDHEYKDIRGFNYNVGFLWNLTDMITLGAVYKSPWKARIDHSVQTQTSTAFPLLDITSTPPPFILEGLRTRLKFPLSYGAGLAFRLSDALTIALDAYRTEWGQYYISNESGQKSSPIDARPRSESDIKPTTQVHLGAEYLFIFEKTVIPVRGGVFYDPEPSEGSPEDFYGISFGSGISIGNMILDAAYQYRWGVDVENKGVPDTQVDVHQHSFYISATYHF